MSTVQGYDHEMREEEIARAQRELERRRLEEARLRAEQAAAMRREVLAAAAEHERQTAAALGEQGSTLGDVAQRAAAIDRASSVLSARASQLDSDLARTATELTAAREELASQIGRIDQLRGAVVEEADLMHRSLEEARQGLAAVERMARATVRDAEILTKEARRTEELALTQGEIASRLARIEREIRFVTQDQALAPAAMATLMTMEASGFQLRDTISRKGLVAYFAKSDLEHQIAVRLAPAARSGENVERWEALAETFGYHGEKCLQELASIEKTMEQLDVGSLEPTSFRVYPKDDRSPRPRLRGVVPKPRPTRPERRRRDRRQKTRGK